MERHTLECQIFSWKGWDQLDDVDLAFEDVELKVPVGEFPAGTKFPNAFLLISSSMLILLDTDEQEHAFELNVSVGQKITPPEVCEDACGCGHNH
jgi:hypothetical protein